MNRDTRRTRLLLAFLLLVAFTLITIDMRQGDESPLTSLRSFGARVFGPVERAAGAVVGGISEGFDRLGRLDDDADEMERLRRENEELRGRLRTSELDHARAEEMERLLGAAGRGQYKTLPAQVIAVGNAQGFSWTVTLDVGSGDGVKPDMTVLSGEGLVGRVTTVGPATATVLLASDPMSSVGARLEGSMEIGIVTGRGNELLELELLDPQAPMNPGDRLVTFGSRGNHPFVPGVPLGEVVSVQQTPGELTRKASVRPYIDFTSLDIVGVVVEPPRTDPRDAVLPPLPSPSPTQNATSDTSETPQATTPDDDTGR